jgi:chromosome segregation ATPase
MLPEGIDSLNADSLKSLVLSLLARIDELSGKNNSLLGRIDELSEQNKKLLEQISELLARIAELEARSGKPPKTPTNSSLPPSSGQKANVANAPKTNKNRKGRPGVARELSEPRRDARHLR